MKRLILVALALIAVTSRCPGMVLTPGTLAEYLALGSGGGTIGSTLFSNFALLPNQGGATAIDPNDILVTPIDLSGTPTLQFAFDQTALTAELFELHLSYDVSDFAILGAGVGLSAVMTSDDAAVTALLALTGPSPAPAPLIAFETLGISSLEEQTTFLPVGLLTVESDIVIDGGLEGLSHLGVVTNQFSVMKGGTSVPEGGSAVWLLASGLAGVGLLRRRLVPTAATRPSVS